MKARFKVSKVGKNREKTGGRQKGTPNKKTKELIEILGAFNPVEKLKDIFANTKDDCLKAKICLDLLKYIYPQRKAIDFQSSENNGFTVIVQDEKAKKMLDEL